METTASSSSLTTSSLTTTANKQVVYEEGELALLSCNLQAYPKAQVVWFKKFNDLENELVIDGELSRTKSGEDGNNDNNSNMVKYAQLSGLLLIGNVNRNDSGVYVCQVKNSIGEDRLELELLVKG